MDQKNEIFHRVVATCHASIYRICLAYLYDRSHADDLYQEIMLQVWKSIGNYRGDAKLNTWVYRIATNTAITYNLQHKKMQHEVLPDSAETLPDYITHPERELRLVKLTEAIHKLEEQDRIVISLFMENLSYKEIAEVTGSNVNSIGVKINRIKTRIMKLIENSADYGNI